MQKQVHCYWEKMLVAANIALFTDKQINKDRKYPGFVFFETAVKVFFPSRDDYFT